MSAFLKHSLSGVGYLLMMALFAGITLAALYFGDRALAPSDPFRILSNGTQYYVQEYSSLGWSDDIWGGYQPSYEAASNRVVELRKWRAQRENDKATKRAFKPVAQ